MVHKGFINFYSRTSLGLFKYFSFSRSMLVLALHAHSCAPANVLEKNEWKNKTTSVCRLGTHITSQKYFAQSCQQTNACKCK